MSADKFEMDPGFFLEDKTLGDEQVRWLFAQKVVKHLNEAVHGSKTFGSDIEFCIADYADAYPGFDTQRAAAFAEAAMLRTDVAVRRGEDAEFKTDLENLMTGYARL
jgi:hypothetical protein